MPDELHEAIHAERERTGKSLNQTVIDLLRQRLGVEADSSNGLARLSGTWTQAQYDEFVAATAPFEEIDTELWK